MVQNGVRVAPNAVPRSGSDKEPILATTTSSQDSGLLDVLVPLFQQQTGYQVKTVSMGTGAALALGGRGEADVVLVHAPESDQQWMAQGNGTERLLVMALRADGGDGRTGYELARAAGPPLLIAVAAGFGRAISDVGASVMVGGNIVGQTRILTTASAIETGRGGFALAIALGIVLLLLALVVNRGARPGLGGQSDATLTRRKRTQP